MTQVSRALIVLAACAIAATASAQSSDATKAALVKKKAAEMGEAFKKEDFATFVDMTYPKVVEVVGRGRKNMIAELEAGMKQFKEKGYTFRSLTVGEPGEMLTEGPNTFVVVPTVTEITTPDGKSTLKSYLLGISPDDGKTWTFVSGDGLGTAEERQRLLPKLPRALALPEPQEPKINKESRGE